MTNETGWILIPPPIIEDHDIPMGAKVLCGLVLGLITSRGYCWASSDYLGERLGFTKGSVRNYLSLLYKKGYLYPEMIKKKGQVTERRIYTTLVINRLHTRNNPRNLNMTTSIKERNIKESNAKSISNKKLEKIKKDIYKKIGKPL